MTFRKEILTKLVIINNINSLENYTLNLYASWQRVIDEKKIHFFKDKKYTRSQLVTHKPCQLLKNRIFDNLKYFQKKRVT